MVEIKALPPTYFSDEEYSKLNFSCPHHKFQDYFFNCLRDYHKRKICAGTLLFYGDDLIGYFSLAASAISRNSTHRKTESRIKDMNEGGFPVPAINIDFLCKNFSCNEGLFGSTTNAQNLVAFAIEAAKSSNLAPVLILEVEGGVQKVINFYKNDCGFLPLKDSKTHPFLYFKLNS